MSITVHIPTPLRRLTGGLAVVEVDAKNIGQLIERLDAAHPGLKTRLCNASGRLRRFVSVLVDGQDAHHLDGLQTPLEAGAQISILPSVIAQRRTA